MMSRQPASLQSEASPDMRVRIPTLGKGGEESGGRMGGGRAGGLRSRHEDATK